MPTTLPTRALIDGSWLDGGAGSFPVHSPQSGELIASQGALFLSNALANAQ